MISVVPAAAEHILRDLKQPLDAAGDPGTVSGSRAVFGT